MTLNISVLVNLYPLTEKKIQINNVKLERNVLQSPVFKTLLDKHLIKQCFTQVRFTMCCRLKICIQNKLTLTSYDHTGSHVEFKEDYRGGNMSRPGSTIPTRNSKQK